MYQFISGMMVMGYAVAGMFFVRYWRGTGDRLFAWFATAFWLLAGQRFALVATNPQGRMGIEEHYPGLYILRLAAFVLILIAIADKNRRR